MNTWTVPDRLPCDYLSNEDLLAELFGADWRGDRNCAELLPALLDSALSLDELLHQEPNRLRRLLLSERAGRAARKALADWRPANHTNGAYDYERARSGIGDYSPIFSFTLEQQQETQP